MTLTIDLDDGGLTTTLQTHIDGFGPDPDQLTIGEGAANITLSPAWQSIAEEALDERTDPSVVQWQLVSTRSFPNDPHLYVRGQVSGYGAFPWSTQGSWPSACEWTDCPSVSE